MSHFVPRIPQAILFLPSSLKAPNSSTETPIISSATSAKAVTHILRSSWRNRIHTLYISFVFATGVEHNHTPFGVRESSHSAFDTTMVGIAIPTQSGDRHCWFYGKPTTVFLLQLFERERLCVGRRYRFSVFTPFRSRSFSTAVLCRRASRFDSLIDFRSCLLSGSTSFSLNGNTFANRILCMRVRQLDDARLFRHGRKCTLSSAATNRMTASDGFR